MKVLAIGDIHDDIKHIETIISNIEHDVVVFVGDYFDSFKSSLNKTRKTVEWLKYSLEQPNRIHILGNHDIQYYYANVHLYCSGYDGRKRDIIKHVSLMKLIPFVQIDNIVYSHAGFQRNLLHPYFGFKAQWESDKIKEELTQLNYGYKPVYFGAGRDRGGDLEVGGITWLDWDSFEPVDDLNQVVGHTHGDKIRYKVHNNSINACIDCYPNYVLTINGGEFQEIMIKEKTEKGE